MQNRTTPRLERLMGAFQRFARTVVRTSGHPAAFGLAIGAIVVWLVTGRFSRFSSTWVMVIDTAANITTFLMIFLIRNAQNRESETVQLKLDELIRATKSAHNSLLDIEQLSEAELGQIKAGFERLARKARQEPDAAPATVPPAETGIAQAVIAPVAAVFPPPKEFVL
jgi:low affinity Fe/Cu permease